MTNTQKLSKTNELTRAAIVTGLYIAITLALAPVSFGFVQFRVSEAFNFLALYNKRYIWAVTLGVAIANFIGSTPVDMVVGGLQTLVFLTIGRFISQKFAGKRWFGLNSQHLIFNLIFSFSMIVIAVMLTMMYDLPLMFMWGTLFVSEFLILFVGGLLFDFMSKFIDFTK
ncbi:MAG: QueT transporter family protein [Streptococcaceae bacterium]|jgi:uncharacterized membrane protein|nr:QueT transporter family protein [Streptococcaceae bacterium]